MGKYFSDSHIKEMNKYGGVGNFGSLLDNAMFNALNGPVLQTGAIPFQVTGQLVCTVSATPVIILPASAVPAGKQVFVSDAMLVVNGATAWSGGTGTKVVLQDTAAGALISYATAILTANAIISSIGGASQTLSATILTGAGVTAGLGLAIASDNNYGAGSTIYYSVGGVIK